MNVSPYLGDWDPYYGDRDTFPNFAILTKNLLSGTIQHKRSLILLLPGYQVSVRRLVNDVNGSETFKEAKHCNEKHKQWPFVIS